MSDDDPALDSALSAHYGAIGTDLVDDERFAKRIAAGLSNFAPSTRRDLETVLAAPFPDEWLAHLRQHVAIYELLADTEQDRLRDDSRVFIAEKTWEGCGGLAVTDHAWGAPPSP